MKKIILTSILAAAAMSTNAQLVVDTLGHVGIGTETPKSKLSIGYDGDVKATVYCKADKQYGMYCKNFTFDDGGENYGLFCYTKNIRGFSYGIFSKARCGGEMDEDEYAIGLGGHANLAYNSVGVFGGPVTMGATTAVNFAGVFGSSVSHIPLFATPGIYAGYFMGKVRVTGGIYATVLSPTASLSPSGQNGTTRLSEREGRVTDKLNQVQAMQFLRSETTGEETAGEEETGHCLSPVQYGLDAAQLKAVYPELVYEDANGNVSINYVEMVPLLVQSINELSARVAELEGNSAKKAKAKAETTGIEDNVSGVDMVRMDQNKPNPFSESTVITLNIPSEAQTASIFIYDMSGKQVQSIPVAERGETDITVYARDLSAGMYIYTLVVDGKVKVTRRMIVSEI